MTGLILGWARVFLSATATTSPIRVFQRSRAHVICRIPTQAVGLDGALAPQRGWTLSVPGFERVITRDTPLQAWLSRPNKAAAIDHERQPSWECGGVDASLPAFEAWRRHLPPILIDGARNHPEIVVPELANLVCDEQSGMVAAGTRYPPVFLNPYRIDRDRMAALLGDHLDEALARMAEYAGENAYAVRAKDAAKSWLEERKAGENKPTPNPPTAAIFQSTNQLPDFKSPNH